MTGPEIYMKYILVPTLMLIAQVCYAQSILHVTDGVEGLAYVDVYSSDSLYYHHTDNDGYITIPDSLVGQLSFRYTGYETVSYSLTHLRSVLRVDLKKGMLLEEVVLIGRTDERTQDVVNHIESILPTDIQMTNPQTSADALGQHAGVYIQKSQLGGGSPVIRGFEANKVLLVVDGVRMNNAIYRGGHLQNAITVDASILDRMEVIYGPGSLVYGSDALGGVVHFRSKNPQLSLDGLSASGEGYLRYASANNEKTAHLHLNLGGKKWASLTSVTSSEFGDLVIGSSRSAMYPDFGKRPFFIDRIEGRDSIVQNPNENKQVATAYSQLDIMQKIVYRPSDHLRLIANVQHSTSTNVPRYDALTDTRADGSLKYAEWYYGPQKRWLASLRADVTAPTSLYDKLILIAAYQSIDEDRVDRKYRSTQRDFMNEDVSVYSITADFHKSLSDSWSLSYGLESTYNSVNSTAHTEDIDTGISTRSETTRYPSARSSTTNVAAYLLSKKRYNALSLIAGMRYSLGGLSVRYDRADAISWPETYYTGLSSSHSALSWSLGGQYNLGMGWKIKSQVATAFRSPNIDDLAKIRIKNGQVSIPNLDLGPESSLTKELTLSKYRGKSYISGTVFHTSLDDAIVREEFTLPDGTSYLLDEGDTLHTIANINAASAAIWGISLNAKYVVNNHWHLSVNANRIKGTSIADDGTESPLAHIPPLYGRIVLGYGQGKHKGSLAYRYNGKKPIDQYGGSEDNPENATPDGSPSWATWNIYYLYQLTDQMRISLSVENILDRHYRPFASGLSSAGRNVSLTFGVKL